MKKFLIICTLVVTTITAASAQHGDCILPTCEEIGDPELTPENRFTVYPNPGKGMINISVPAQPFTQLVAKVYDFQGRLIHSQSLSGFSQPTLASVDLVRFPKGTYFIVFTDKNKLAYRIIYRLT